MAPNPRGYKLWAHNKTKTGYVRTWAIVVPHRIAKSIPKHTLFQPELTNEGILYRRVDPLALGLPTRAREGT